MAIKRVSYSKEFLSETDQEDVSRHGSPEWEPYQKINSEDEKLRKEIDKRFSFKEEMASSMGFDGRFQYEFIITNNLRRYGVDPLENRIYQTKVAIKKAGNQEELDGFSDLEEFLINLGFEKI